MARAFFTHRTARGCLKWATGDALNAGPRRSIRDPGDAYQLIERGRMDRLSLVKREARRTGGVALYLFICFAFFTTLGKLVLATYQIEYYPLLPAVVGTLALAKVVVLLDMTPVAMRLETKHPLWLATLYKTLFYCAVSGPVLVLERVWHFHREAGSWRGAVEQAWTQADQNRVLAKILIVGIVFGCYHFYHGIDRRLGEGELWRMIRGKG